MGKNRLFNVSFPGLRNLTPFRLIGVSVHFMDRCFMFPTAWGARDYIRIRTFPEGGILTSTVYWQWLWFQIRIIPKVTSQSKG